MERKAACYIERTKYPLGRYITSIEYERTGEAVCIRVAAADHLYVTEDYIVTHNTFQAISAVVEHFLKNDVENGPKLIVCPASVKGVWARELALWLGKEEPFVVLEGSYGPRKATPAEAKALGLPPEKDGKPTRLTGAQVKSLVILEAVEKGSWVITNWESLRTTTEQRTKTITTQLPNGEVRRSQRKERVEVLREPLFGTTQWQAVIADEAHRAKSRKSLQTKGLWKIDAPMKLALSGTPIMNSPDEIWPLLKWLYPDEFGNSIPARWKNGTCIQPSVPKQAYWAFYDMYVDSYNSDYGRVITGAKNPDALRFLLSKRLVRRTKGEKLDLPPKTRQIIPVTLGKKQRKLYEDAEKEMWLQVEQEIKGGDKSLAKFAKGVEKGKVDIYDMPNGAVRTGRLRQIASTPALLGAEDDSAKLDYAVEIIADAQPKQFIVFSEFVDTCKLLVERLETKGIKAKQFTGSVTPAERTVLERQFQEGDIDVLVGTIKAMGEGVTLHACDTAIFIERDWTPARNEQAEDRIWRVGQDNHVTILILEGVNTVDSSKVNPTNAFKAGLVSAIVKQEAVEEPSAC